MRRCDRESCRGREDEGLTVKGVAVARSQEFMVENDWNVPLHLSKICTIHLQVFFHPGLQQLLPQLISCLWFL